VRGGGTLTSLRLTGGRFRLRYGRDSELAFQRITERFTNDIGDRPLATSSTLIYVKGKGIELRERQSSRSTSLPTKSWRSGTEAKRMLGRTPEGIRVNPVR